MAEISPSNKPCLPPVAKRKNKKIGVGNNGTKNAASLLLDERGPRLISDDKSSSITATSTGELPTPPEGREESEIASSGEIRKDNNEQGQRSSLGKRSGSTGWSPLMDGIMKGNFPTTSGESSTKPKDSKTGNNNSKKMVEVIDDVLYRDHGKSRLPAFRMFCGLEE